MWHFYKLTEEDSLAAKEQFTGLIKRAPGFAGAHAALAVLELRKLIMGESEEREEVLKFALFHATKAVELDDESSMARIALSRVFSLLGKYDEAVEEAEMSISLNPSSAAGYLNLAGTLIWGARAEEAMSAIEKSIRLSPRGPVMRVKLMVKGLIFYYLGDYDAAEPLVRQAEASYTLTPLAKIFLGVVYLNQGRPEEARGSVDQALELRPNITGSRLRAAWQTLAPVYRDKILGDLKTAGLPD